MLLIPFWGLYTAVTSLPRSSNNPIITVCHTDMDDPHTTCSAGEPDPPGRQPNMAVRVLPQRGPLNGFKYHISAFVGKSKTRTWNQLWNYIIWGYEKECENYLKEFHFLPLSLSFFSLFFSLNRFMSRQATCVLFSPIRQSWQCKDLIIWKVWKVKVSKNTAISLLYKYVCKWEVRIKDVIKCHQLHLDLLCADAFSWNVSQILTQRRRWKYSPWLQFILEQTLWALPLSPHVDFPLLSLFCVISAPF